MIERELKLNTQINTYSVGGQVFTDLRELEVYMTNNNVTTVSGNIPNTSISSTDFVDNAQAIREEFFSNTDDTTFTTGDPITNIVDDNVDGDDVTDGNATGFL